MTNVSEMVYKRPGFLVFKEAHLPTSKGQKKKAEDQDLAYWTHNTVLHRVESLLSEVCLAKVKLQNPENQSYLEKVS